MNSSPPRQRSASSASLLAPLCAALLGLAGVAKAQPANVPLESERGSGTQMERGPKMSTQPATNAGAEVRSNPGGLGQLDSPRPSVPGGKDEPSPRTEAGRSASAPAPAPLKGRERDPRRTGGASIDQTREPSTDPRESGAR
ncbi:hypothetical protein L602_000400001010 [Cupriavidus gilardii J11]|uniref:Translation initiation factor IF-2 n=1 Tax=Cupriavidus gilardii J11 TaxID=936133 RepID=A0A562B9D1_9BURK|nr:hypothetical protein [Cupriavidus gilardii]TWG81782.1 hypothetical protein L602_000400001010 [Cupriavidus gilardii J11]